jgi:hypothetical protein
MSRRFAGVGVGIGAARLRDMSVGAPASDDELTDVNFALAVTELQREKRRAKLAAGRRWSTRCLLVAGMIVLMLNLLACMAYLFFSFAAHTSPW